MNTVGIKPGALALGLIAVVSLIPYAGAFVLAPSMASAPDAAHVRAAPIAAPAAPEATEVAAFLDTALPRQMAQEHIAGAAVAVVKDGAIIAANGYGYADFEHERPVSADQTIFLTGSTGKLFTWTAVMQLVEQGRLDLDADVNSYLDLQIPATYPEPITLTHLMSHSAGFEDRAFLYAHDPAELVPLGHYLAANLPARVRPPGVLSAYSNYGAALAGYIVERVAGQPFEHYIAEHLFEPLAMHSSSFQQPLPPVLQAKLSASYAFSDGAFRRVPPKYIRTPSTGASVATVTDMAHFMIAHLEGGRYGTGRILDERTATRMHQRLWTQDPRVNGFAHGFAESTVNGLRLLRHEGVVPGNGSSALVLLPEQRLGLYVAYNGNSDMTTGTRLWHAFLDRLYPAPATQALQPAATSAAQLRDVAGTYRSSRRPFTSFAKLMVLFGGALGDIRVSVADDSGVRTDGLGPQPLRWVAAEQDVFRLADDADTVYGRLVFRPGADGAGHMLLIENMPYRAYEQVAWYQTSAFNLALVALCAGVFASALVLVPLTALWRRRSRTAIYPAAPLRWARRLAATAAALYVLFVPLLLLISTDAISYGISTGAVAVFILPVAATGLMAASLVCAARGWRDRAWAGVLGRGHYAGMLLAATAFTWWLHAWNLLGFRF